MSIKASGDANALWLSPDVRGTEPSNSANMFIEHPIDRAEGAADRRHFVVNPGPSNSAMVCRLIPQTGTVPSDTTAPGTFWTSQDQGDTVDGLDVGLWPAMILANSDVLFSRLLAYKESRRELSLSVIDVDYLGGAAGVPVVGRSTRTGTYDATIKFAQPGCDAGWRITAPSDSSWRKATKQARSVTFVIPGT